MAKKDIGAFTYINEKNGERGKSYFEEELQDRQSFGYNARRYRR